MRLPSVAVLLLLYAASGVVGQPQIVNPGEPNPDSTPTSLSTTETTSTETTTTTTSEASSSTTSTETTSSSSDSSTSSSTETTTIEISSTTTSTTSTETPDDYAALTVTTETTTSTTAEDSTTTTSSSTETSTTTTTSSETTTTESSSTETTETSSTTVEELTTTEEPTSTTSEETTSTASSTTTTSSSDSENSTTETSSSTSSESDTSTTDSSTSTTDSTTTTSSTGSADAERADTATSESTTTADTTTADTTTADTTTADTTTADTTTTESTATDTTTTATESTATDTTTTTESTTTTTTESETTTETSTETETSTTETNSTTESSSTTTETTDSTTTTTDVARGTDTVEATDTATSQTTSETDTATTTSDSATTETTSTDTIATDTTFTDTTSTDTTATGTTSTETTTTDSTSTDTTTTTETTSTDTDTAATDATSTDSTATDSTSTETTSTSLSIITEYVYPTNGCNVPGARCHFYSMQLDPTVYFVTTLTVDESATTSLPDFNTVAGFSTENPDITTIQPDNTILSNTGNIIPSSVATASNLEDIYLPLPITYEFIFEYVLPSEYGPSDTEAPSTAADDTLPVTTAAPEVCPDNTVLVTIPAESVFELSIFKGCSQYQFFINQTVPFVITTKTAVVIETKQNNDFGGFGAPVTKSKDDENDPGSKTSEGDRRPGLAPVQTSSKEDRPKKGPLDPQTSDQPNRNPDQDITRGPNRNPEEDPNQRPGDRTRSPNPDPNRGPNRGGDDTTDRPPSNTENTNQRESPIENQRTTRGPQPSDLPNPNPNAKTTSPNGQPTINLDDFTLLFMPTTSQNRATPGQTITPGPDPTQRRTSPEPILVAKPIVSTVNGVRTTKTTVVGITSVPKTSEVKLPNGSRTVITLLTESTIPVTSFPPRVTADPVITTINGRRTTFLTVMETSAKPSVMSFTTTISSRRTVISSTFFLPTTITVPQFTPYLTTTIGPTIINGIPTLGPMVVTLAPSTRTTYLTDIESGTTRLRRTTYILPATSTLPDPLVKTIRISTVVNGITTTLNLPISVSALPTSRVITTSIDGTRRVITTTFFVPQGVPALSLPSVVLYSTTVDGQETTFSEFYSIQPVSVTTTINGQETVVLVPSAVPITTPKSFFSTSFRTTTVDGRRTSIPEVYFLQPTTTTTVIDGITSVISTTTAVLVTAAPLPEVSTGGLSVPNNSTANRTIAVLPKITGPLIGVTYTPPPAQTDGASNISLNHLFICFGALVSSILVMLM